MFPYDPAANSPPDPYPLLRSILAPQYQDAAPEEIESLVASVTGDQWSADDAEWVQILAAAIPALVSAVPAIVQAFQRPQQQRPASPPPQRPPARPPPHPQTPPPQRPPVGTSTVQPQAIGQLLTTLTTLLPQLIQALSAMGLGSGGRESIQVGEHSFPVEAFPQMLKVLSEQAIEEYRAARFAASESLPTEVHLNGGYDPASPEARAQALWETLTENVPALEDIPYVENLPIEDIYAADAAYEMYLDEMFADGWEE